MKLFEELKWRGFVDNVTSQEVPAKLDKGGETFYIGFDPSGDSFHIGQLAVFNLMQMLTHNGHNGIALMGGATGMIGDPSGKSKERNILSSDQIKSNISHLEKQFRRLLDFDSGRMKLLNNIDWLGKFSYIDMLRDVGKNFPVSVMLARDSVSSRLEREGEGITYTEFSYMILQAYDFYHLSKHHRCTMQFGGSDQWGNILSGIDLTRRLGGGEVFGMTMPLVTKADGTKFGKSEGRAIWLDESKTSVFEFYQFFVRQTDADVIRFLKLLTRLDKAEIDDIETKLKAEPEKRYAQKRLAEEVTRIVHGQENLKKIIKAADAIYDKDIVTLDPEILQEVFKDAPSYEVSMEKLKQGWLLADALAETGLCASKSKGRQLVEGGGFYLNNEKVSDFSISLGEKDLIKGRFFVLRSGRKNYLLVKALAQPTA